MSKSTWNVDASNLPTIDLHTKAKHQILEKYIENLIITLYAKARHGVTTFTFIDGFCGGIYDNKDDHSQWEGSPIKIIKAVREGYKKSRRKYPLNIKYIFIDNNREHLNCLKNHSMPKAGMEELIDSQPHKFRCGEFEDLVEQCEFKLGEFENLIDWCVLTLDIRKGHSFFLLDPCGWTDVSMKSIKKINSLKGSEILYTYMIDFLKRFVIGKHGKDKNTFNRVLEAYGYYESANLEAFDRIGEQCYLRNESMRLFRNQGNAKYVFTFSLIPRGDIRSLYYLIHLSNNLTALEVIKESFWQENNLDYQYYFKMYGHGFRTADFYEEGQASLRFDITKDSQQFCIEQLDHDLGNIIYNNQDGIRILTRGLLWVKDIDILNRSNVVVGMSLPYLDDELSRKIEPQAPPPSKRYEALLEGHQAGCRLYIAVAPTPPNMTLDDFKRHLEKIMYINPEVIFWEPINARGTNGKRMVAAGLEFAHSIMSKKSWVECFIKQWEEIEAAAISIGCDDRLHIWPDPELRGYIDEAKLQHWLYKPTVEKWDNLITLPRQCRIDTKSTALTALSDE